MTNKMQCATHGECEETFVCIHVTGDATGRGFNREEPSDEKPFPDAWCDDCELIFAAHDGWNDESSKLTEIVLLCSGCYERARIRNTHTSVTLDDLADLRWKCGSCEEWHTGPCLDFSYAAPYYWSQEYEKVNAGPTEFGKEIPETFLNEDYCAIENQHFFVRGIIHLPIWRVNNELSSTMRVAPFLMPPPCGVELTLAASKKRKPLLKMPRPCAVECHA